MYIDYIQKIITILIIKSIDMQGEPHPHATYPDNQRIHSAISIASTMPPSKIRKNIVGLITIAPSIEDQILQKIDLPLQIQDSDSEKPFLKTEFNRDGDSYRSPYTNNYIPQAEGYQPTGDIRRMEEIGCVLFGQYTKLYYGTSGTGSFYVSQGANPRVFSCGYFAKKSYDQGEELKGTWDSFNVADVQLNGDEITISLQSTVLIQLAINRQTLGNIDLSGFLKKKKVQKRKVGKEVYEDALVAMGEMVEEQETLLRQHLQSIYVGKVKEIVFTTRYEYTVEYENQKKNLAHGLKQIHLGH